jgi:hypothetical protein
MHSTRYCADELGVLSEHSPARLPGSSWRYLDAVKLHEVRLHFQNWLVGGGSNKCATQFGDARSSYNAQPWQLARFHPCSSFLIPDELLLSKNMNIIRLAMIYARLGSRV